MELRRGRTHGISLPPPPRPPPLALARSTVTGNCKATHWHVLVAHTWSYTVCRKLPTLWACWGVRHAECCVTPCLGANRYAFKVLQHFNALWLNDRDNLVQSGNRRFGTKNPICMSFTNCILLAEIDKWSVLFFKLVFSIFVLFLRTTLFVALARFDSSAWLTLATSCFRSLFCRFSCLFKMFLWFFAPFAFVAW